MDRIALETLALLVHKALDIQEQHFGLENSNPGIHTYISAIKAGVPQDLAQLVCLVLGSPGVARDWAEHIVPRGRASTESC